MCKTAVLTIENAKEMYKSGIPSIVQFALNNYSKKELEAKSLPKSWKELNTISGYYIVSNGDVYKISNNTQTSEKNRNIFPTESLVKASMTLSQLLQFRNV